MNDANSVTESTRADVLVSLQRMRDQLAEIETWIGKYAGAPWHDESVCCQLRGASWYEVCDICIANGEAEARLHGLSDGVIALYAAERSGDVSRGSYASFIDVAGDLEYHAVSDALDEIWHPDDEIRDTRPH